MLTRALMSKNRARKERFAALAADLKNQRVVAAIDAEMKEMIEDWLDLSFLRERAAQRHKVNSPPPAFPVDPAVMAPSVYRKNSRQAPPTKPIQDLKLVNGSEADICWQIIEPRETGISTAEMRVEFASRIPGKSHHAGIQRLKNSGHVVSDKNRLWASHRLEKFRADVTAGLVKDIDAQPRFQSRWQDVILEYLRNRASWATTGEVAKYVRGLPGFSEKKNVLSAVCLALRNLNYRHKLIEKQGAGRGSKWRAIPQGGNAECVALADADVDLELEFSQGEVRH